MRIYSMTATFGKLEHQTLTLQPGLNIIEAPNEWGKSTWCAFLVAMLYGIDTSARSKKDHLAAKERYAPWSGQNMSGRMELQWQGRDITIERSTKGRIPFGQFLAYETHTHVAVTELTAENCGQILLGVEQNVFLRAGFLRLADLPVTQDEALRRRLNALVTTGDESGAGDALAQKLRDLKNRCRHNKTGLLPQAEAQAQTLEATLRDLQFLEEQCNNIAQQEQLLAQRVDSLKNHQTALAYTQAEQARLQLEKALAAQEEAKAALDALDKTCEGLPTRQTAEQELHRLGQLQQQWATLQTEADTLPTEPVAPSIPAVFAGMDSKQAIERAESDRSAYNMLCKPLSPLLPILAGISLIAALGLVFVNWILSLPCCVLSALFLERYFHSKAAQKRDRQAITRSYGSDDPDSWVALAHTYDRQSREYAQALQSRQVLADQLAGRRESLLQTMNLLTGGEPLSDCLARWNRILTLRDEQEDAAKLYLQTQNHAQAFRSVVRDAPAPAMPDALTLSQDETDHALTQAAAEQQQLHQRYGQYQGQMEALGTPEVLQRQLCQVRTRIEKLEQTYAALTLAQETLATAATQLQRRFAPRISGKAQALFSRLTGQRYDRLTLGEDLSVSAAAREEDTLHGAIWRSDGTIDQLYLALRLAVAAELTPQAPLILDDALVRFDDTRLGLALEILKEEAVHKQVILFTCQGREQSLSNIGK